MSAKEFQISVTHDWPTLTVLRNARPIPFGADVGAVIDREQGTVRIKFNIADSVPVEFARQYCAAVLALCDEAERRFKERVDAA